MEYGNWSFYSIWVWERKIEEEEEKKTDKEKNQLVESDA